MTKQPPVDKHRPRKRFGQNFLTDQVVIENIVSAVSPKPSDHLIEIGPGQGALTTPLLAHNPMLTVVEIDRDLADALTRRYASKPTFTLYQGDALKVDFAALSAGQPMRIIGNLPYNISTPLLFHLLSYNSLIIDMHFMLQKEVVDRLAASPGSKNYGRLSVMMQYHGQVQGLFEVPPGAFRPQPKVTSAVVRIAPHQTLPHRAVSTAMFSQIVKLSFQQRRKTLRNSLKKLFHETTELSNFDFDFDLTARPETLSVRDFVTLSNYLSTKQ